MYVIGKRLGVGILSSVIFWVRYFINTALLVVIHIGFTQKWVAQHSALLRSERHTERRYIYKLYGPWDWYFINTPVVVCCYNNESYIFYFLYFYNYLYVVITTKSNMRRGMRDNCFDAWVLYCIYTPLLVGLEIVLTWYMAWGHRCSLRHNVCRHATSSDCEMIQLYE